jgi:hypothetical protein
MSTGIADITPFSEILVDNAQGLLEQYQKQGLIHRDGTTLRLSDE